MKSSSVVLLSLVVALAAFFRFSRNDMLQFWSDDEEIHAAVVQRMIALKRPTLVSPQPTLGTSIGSFFHMASVPLFLIFKMDPEKILSLFSITGLLTTLVIYVLGKEIGGRKVGFVASFLYATSFLAGLYDRRWWPITWTPLLSAIGLLAASRFIKTQHHRYLLILAAVTASALHGDPAMMLFGLFTTILLMIYRIRISWHAWIISASIVLIAILPIALFELRHPGTIVRPLLETVQKKQLSIVQRSGFTSAIALTAETTRWLFFPKPTDHLEPLLYPMNVTSSPVERIAQIAIVSFILGYFFLHAYPSRKVRPEMFVISLYLFTFFLGLLVFVGLYRHEPQRVYMTLLFPALFVIAASILLRVTTSRNFLLGGFLFLYLTVNTVTLFKSRYKYPLSTRQNVVSAAIKALGGKDFSLYVVGDPYLVSGGFTRLFIMNGAIPKKSFTDKILGWWYRTHSLYLTEPTEEDQDRIVYIVPSNRNSSSDHLVANEQIDTIRLLIFENETRWFNDQESYIYYP